MSDPIIIIVLMVLVALSVTLNLWQADRVVNLELDLMELSSENTDLEEVNDHHLTTIGMLMGELNRTDNTTT